MSQYEHLEQVAKVLETWLEEVNKGNVGGIACLYSENAVLIPTFSDKILTTSKERWGYFENLGKYDKVSVELDGESLVVQNMEGKLYCLGGNYYWKFEIGAETKQFAARFTFNVDLSRATPITHHHSSQVLEKL